MMEHLRRWLGMKSIPDPPSREVRVETGWREGEENFSQLVAGVRDYAIFLLDPEGRVSTWNAGAERIKGFRAEDIIGQHFSRFYPGEALSVGWPEHELEVAKATGRFEEEGWRLRKDGSRFWASIVITALFDSDGRHRGFLKITRDLTDRRQAEEKLRLSEERFRLLVEGCKDYAIFMLDPQGRVITWNVGAERLKGFSASDIIGKHFSVFYPQDAIDRGWPEEELRRAIADGRFEDEGWRLRKDGSRFWANVVITALRDETGTLRGFAKLTRDLTIRREAEENSRRLLQEEAARKAAEDAREEIERQREQLQVTLASIGDAVVVTDAEGRVTFLNGVASDLTGWSVEEATGQPLDQVFRLIHEVTGEHVDSPVTRVLREGGVVELANSTALVRRDGRLIPIEDTAAPIRVGDGVVRGAVLIFRDVTDARRSREARQYLAAIVESSDDAIVGITLDGKVASWNRGAERLFGYSADEMIGHPLSILIPQDNAGELKTLLDRVGGGDFIEHFQTRRRHKNGQLVDVSLTVSPVRDAEGKVFGASKIARDITAQKQEDRRKNEFLALLAHELRNPLAPLRNGLQLLQLSGDKAEIVDKVRTIMDRQLTHLVRLVDDLLDVSRISRGKLNLHKERLPLADIVAHALDVCGPFVKNQDHELIVRMPDEPILVDADRVRIAQAISNLLHNAAKYSERGTPIHLSAEQRDGEAWIRVKDLGFGIPPDQLTSVFEMFMQVDRTMERSQGGLGVGLAIVKSLVEMHDGRVEAFSEGYGKGSEFVIRLPVVGANDAAISSPVDLARNVSSPPAAARRILVVDDNVDAAASLAAMLRMMGNDVRAAYDGHAGFELARSFRPEIVFLDIGMPRMNGYDVCRRIREEPWGKDIRIVAVTGWGQDEDKRRSLAHGFDNHLVKPVEPAAIERLLQATA